MSDVKACKKCGIVKPLSEFYTTNNGTRDGHLGSCMVCDRAKTKANRLKRLARLAGDKP